jgi:hypothetical protein
VFYHNVYDFSVKIQSGAMAITSMAALSTTLSAATSASCASWVK